MGYVTGPFRTETRTPTLMGHAVRLPPLRLPVETLERAIEPVFGCE